AGKEQQKESSKKQKVEEEKELEEVDEAELKKLLVIKKDEDIAIDAIDGSSKRYSSMIRMLQGIDREDLEALWRIVKVKYGDTRVTIWKLIDSSGVHFVRRNLKIPKMNIKFRGGLLGLKRLHGFLEVTTAQCCWWKDYNCVKTFYRQEDKDELKRQRLFEEQECV
ncbi:hypothetical protein Tco_0034822, partial [Tanacetum coccineum]